MLTLTQPLLRSTFTSVILEFLDADDRKPLYNARVQVDLLGTDGKPSATLFRGRTNAEFRGRTNGEEPGPVQVRIPVPRVVAGQPAKPLPRIRIRVFDLDGDVLLAQDVQPEANKTITITVSDAPQKKKITAPFGDGTLVLGRKFSQPFGALLTRHKVDSLATLRSADPAVFAALPDQDKRDLAELRDHAQLQVASRDNKHNQALVKANYRSVLDIARQSRSEFTAKMKAAITEDAARNLHATARQQVLVVGTLHTEQQARQANAMSTASYASPAVEPSCACDCASAVSPQAYLVDLLDYAVDNAHFAGSPITLAKLENIFGQPFAALPVDCAFATLLVRQVRLCVEVLHRRNVLSPTNKERAEAVAGALAAHATRAYEALLRGLGTSYRELRLARSNEEARKRLAERLGVAPEHVDSLRLELNSTDINRQLNEDRLERLFGLQATARDPLSTGVTLNDEQGQITRWQLQGVELGKNTNDLGRIHVSLVKQPTGNIHAVVLFKRGARDQASRLGKGSIQGTSGEVELVAENNSGLAGRFAFNYTADDIDISLTVVPEWTIRRKSQLRTLWQQADHPASVFDAPMVDPDIVAESDLMQPYGENPAHKLWTARKDELQKRRAELNGLRPITKMLADAFSAPIDLAAWDAIATELQSPDAGVVASGANKLSALSLTQQAFSFLRELAQREAANREVKPEEREQALDLLINLYKTKKFAAWRGEEAAAKIRLSAPFFLLSEAEPALNLLRASAEARGNWRAELERNSAAPLIDPDAIGEANFAPGAASTPAYETWLSRRALLGDGRPADDPDLPVPTPGSLFQAVATIDSAAKLDAALTTPAGPLANLPGREPLFHHIGFTAKQVKDIASAFNQGGRLPVTPEHYGLTMAQLRTLFEVRRLGANADASDWEQVHHILVLAEKRRYLYPLWRTEEATAGITLNPDLFHLPSGGLAEFLPLLRLTPGFVQWRLDARQQRAWRDQLEARIEQEHAIDVELQTAIDAAEEASLPALRDDLVMATVSKNIGGESLEERKRWVLNHLLINAFENGCRKTTRVAQAIETMQLLLSGIHGGQLESELYSLEPTAETFAEEWGWLGSYATWRSAMFMYLYPENLLLPELRRAIDDHPDRATDPTKLFRAILKVVSGEALPAAAPATGDEEAGDDESDPPQPVEDEELAPFIDRIYRALGERDPLTVEGQKKIFSSLRMYWRSSIREDGSPTDSFSPTNSSHDPIYLPDEPADNETNPYYYVVGRLWYRYRTPSTSAFLEDVLYIPLVFALAQLRRGDFDAALYWFGKVYDFHKTPAANAQGWVDPRLELYFEQRQATGIASPDEWLNDALNPHRIAAMRTGADVRFVILSISRCLLDYADSEFARDSSESLARARELYETARRLLDSSQLGKQPAACSDVLDLISEIGEGHYAEIVRPELERLPPSVDLGSLTDTARDRLRDALNDAVRPTNPPQPRAKVRQAVHDIVTSHFAPKAPNMLDKVRVDGKVALTAAYQRVLDQPKVFGQIQLVRATAAPAAPLSIHAANNGRLVNNGQIVSNGKLERDSPSRRWVPAPNQFRFCIPRNPLVDLLRLRYEVSWFKLNNCLNLAGQQREVPAYAAPTDTSSGLPVADIGSTAGFSAAAQFVPTLYRYRALIERAKQLVAMAQQMEATYLSFLEKRDQETYTILRARQDLGIARANVTLQDLRVTEADEGLLLASLQQTKVEFVRDYYKELFDGGMNGLEYGAVSALIAAAVLQAGAMLVGGAGGFAVTGGASFGTAESTGALVGAAVTGGSGLSTLSSALSMMSSFERRARDWEFQKDLADLHDLEIAKKQVTLAQGHIDIVKQERRISRLGAENASDVLNFLNTKFTNAELYSWMGGIVSGIYRYLLQEATTIAKLSQRQLAFERQETELAVVLDDYWTYTDASAILRADNQSTDRRGMTGSARLLQDITRLDQEAFLTDRRKLQLSKTFSLALHDPIAFARFQESGVLPFATTLEQFDRDFPGHYLRLIKRVRVSVIALAPPTEGIRATLTSTGISRAVRGSTTFTETEIRRDPESIAFTSPINATGLFELQEQPEMLLPFEGNGVATGGWEFSMPRAANVVDYSTIADVLLTIEYTALESAIYRGQVVQRLDRSASGERPFSFRQQFADCWYDLNNPDQLADDQQMRVTFETRRSDFPPNLADLHIEHVSLYFVRQDGFTDPIQVEHLLFTEAGRAGHVGGAATTTNGLISTREANAGSWLPMQQNKQPIGTWELNLLKPGLGQSQSDEIKAWFKDGKIADILFVITFGGTTPEWPK